MTEIEEAAAYRALLGLLKTAHPDIVWEVLRGGLPGGEQLIVCGTSSGNWGVPARSRMWTMPYRYWCKRRALVERVLLRRIQRVLTSAGKEIEGQ